MLIIFVSIIVILTHADAILKIDVFLPNNVSLKSQIERIENEIQSKIKLSFIVFDYHFVSGLSEIAFQGQDCSYKNYTFVVIINNEPLLSFFVEFFTKLQITTISIPMNWFHNEQILSTNLSNFPIGMSTSSLGRLILLVMPPDLWNEVVIFTDLGSDYVPISNLLSEMSDQQIKTTVIYLQAINDSNLFKFMKNSVKGIIRYLVILSNDTSSTQLVLNSAIRAEILQPNYFWLIINNYYQMKYIISLFDSSLNPNIVILSQTFPRILNGSCEVSICKENLLLNSFYFTAKSLIETLNEIALEINIDIDLCHNLTHRHFFTIIFENFKNKNLSWLKFISQLPMFDLFATQSIDTTASVPNVFTYSTKFKLSATFNSSNKQFIKFNNDIYLNIFKHWNNKTIYLCAPPVSPGFTYLSNDKLLPIHKTSGLIKEMLIILSKEMKFTPLFYEASDYQWGALMKDSFNFTGCIGDVFNKKSLFAPSFFTINAMRSLGIEYSVPFFEDSNIATLQYPKRETKIWIVFRPFHWGTWLSLGVMAVVTSIFCYLLSYFSPLSAWNLQLQFSVIDEIRIRENLWNVFGSFLMQGQDFYPYAMSSRTVLAVWWLFTVVIFSAYAADLTSFLTVQFGDKTIKSLEELSLRKDLKIILVEGTASAIDFQYSNNTIFKEIYSRAIFIKNADDCPMRVLEEDGTDLVCISDTSPILYAVKRFCSKIYIIPEKFDSSNLAFPMQKDSPFKPILDMYLRKMVETGQIEKFFAKYWSVSNSSSNDCSFTTNSENAPSITLEDVAGIYISIVVLISISIVMLIFEIIWIKLLKKPLDSFLFQS